MSGKERLPRQKRLTENQLVRLAGRAGEQTTALLQRKTAQAAELTHQETILENENDLQMLQRNEREYIDAVTLNQAYLTMMKMAKSWGDSDEEVSGIYWIFKKGEKIEREDFEAAARDYSLGQNRQNAERGRLFDSQLSILKRIHRFYKDDYDQIIMQLIEDDPTSPVIDLVAEEVRSQRETLGLLRLQINYLRDQRRKELKERKARDRQKSGAKENLVDQVETLRPTIEISKEDILEIEEPFGLSGWQVFWTDTKFSDNPNHLIEMPTDSREAFLLRLEEINTGNRAFQIKTGSVANCVEMWGIPEFRQRAQTSRFSWGPSYVQDWAKLVRGPVRIMMNSNEEAKRLIFFAANRDTVYRGVFAGMSS